MKRGTRLPIFRKNRQLTSVTVAETECLIMSVVCVTSTLQGELMMYFSS